MSRFIRENKAEIDAYIRARIGKGVRVTCGRCETLLRFIATLGGLEEWYCKLCGVVFVAEPEER